MQLIGKLTLLLQLCLLASPSHASSYSEVEGRKRADQVLNSFKNLKRTDLRALNPRQVLSHAFAPEELGKAIIGVGTPEFQDKLLKLEEDLKGIDFDKVDPGDIGDIIDAILNAIWNVILAWANTVFDDCQLSLLAMILDSPDALLSLERPDWAWRMLDASGKLGGSGFFDGNLHAIGTFEECLPIDVPASREPNHVPHPKFVGKYFLAKLNVISTLTPPGNGTDPGNFTLAEYNSGGDMDSIFADKVAAEAYDLLTGFETDFATDLAFVQTLLMKEDDRAKKNVTVSPYHKDYGVDWSLFGDPPPIVQDIILGVIFKRPNLGLCLPDVCPADQIESILHKAIQITLELLTGNNEIEWPFYYKIGDYQYVERVRPYHGGDIACILIFVFFFLMVTIGTLLDIYDTRDEEHHIPQTMPVKFLLCFSAYTNGSKLFSTNNTPQNIDCINGLRVLSMGWVIMGHTYYIGAAQLPWDNPFGIADIYGDWYMNTVFQALFSVDTFFTLGGFLMSFLLIKELEKKNGRVNIAFMYIHRYVRLTPLYGICMLLASTLFLHLSNGPFWHYMQTRSDNCATSWWTNLLYINNFVNQNHLCHNQSWYLAVDFQLFLIGPILVYLMWRFKKWGVAATGVLLVISCIIPGVLTLINDWPPVVTYTNLTPSWFNEFYTRPYNRAAPYIWGIIFGYVMHHLPHKYHRKQGTKLPHWFIIGGWALSAAICLACIFGLVTLYPLNFSCLGTTDCYNKAESFFFAAFARLAWAVGISWVIFACQAGYAGIVGHVLNYPFMAPLSRMTYCAYLIHMQLIQVFHFSRKTIMHFDVYFMFYLFLAHLLLTIVVSVGLTLLFESPFVALEKLLFGGGGRRPRQPRQPQNQEQEVNQEEGGDNPEDAQSVANPEEKDNEGFEPEQESITRQRKSEMVAKYTSKTDEEDL